MVQLVTPLKSFAEGYLNWSEDQWDTVIFSDETHVELVIISAVMTADLNAWVLTG